MNVRVLIPRAISVFLLTLATRAHGRTIQDSASAERRRHPKLREHLAGVIMLLKYSRDWKQFMERLEREHPPWKKGTNLPLQFPADFSGQED